jgi:hypothetical protein
MSGAIKVHMEILEQARAYCEAVWYARTEVFEKMCHERFAMNLIEPDGPTYWDKASFIARVRARAPAEGPASYEVLDIDVMGDQIARVHLTVDIPGTRFEDHLGFVNEDGSWKLLTKVFRIKARLSEG